MSSSAVASPNAIRLYRHLLALARRLPGEKKAAAVDQIRQAFRENALEKDDARVKKLLENASSTLGYLKMVTPKRNTIKDSTTTADDAAAAAASDSEGRIHLIYKDGEGKIDLSTAEKREKARYTNWHGGNLDPDSVARHQHQLSRMGFKDNRHAKGGIF